MLTFGVDWSEPLSVISAVALLALLFLQVGLVVRNKTISGTTKARRLTLNLVLWLVLAAYVVQPGWRKTADSLHVLVAGKDVPAAYVQYVQDSLRIAERFTADDFKDEVDSVTLIGQDIPATLLSQPVLQWIPYGGTDQIQTIRWKGLLRRGEMQRVTGRLQASKKQMLAIRYASQVLDSAEVQPGLRSFSLQFPAFSEGRTLVELTLNGRVLDTLRYFARPTQPLAFRFLLDHPDFESRTLADWLGRNGHSVELTTTVSRNSSNQLTINKSARVPDILITEPGRAADPIVKKAVLAGKSVLFIGLTQPEADTKAINQALGSRWRVRKITNDATVSVGKDLSALPYDLPGGVNQLVVPGYPVAVQKTIGKIGVSLLTETFPLRLSGDSVAYEQLWTAVLAPLQPAFKNNVSAEAPIFAGVREAIQFNNLATPLAVVRIETDTIALDYSPINPLSAEALYTFRRTGWQSLSDSLAVYVFDPQQDPVARRQIVAQYVRAHTQSPVGRGAMAPRWVESRLPAWAWLGLLLVAFTALWIEPKFI